MNIPITFYFKIGESDLTMTSWVVAGIEMIRKELQESPDKKIQVTGHTCDLPVFKPETIAKYGDNAGLSKARAQTVLSLLKSALELPEDKFEVVCTSATQPESTVLKEKNRRTTVELL
jgi:flagellar motor protein MotB